MAKGRLHLGRVVLVFAGALIAHSGSGCAHIPVPRCVDDCLIDLQHRHHAKFAWGNRRKCYAGVQTHLRDFKHGFKDGYIAGINGQTECPPALPPSRYWGACYQGHDAKRRVAAWHDGWAHGAIAADQDGVTNIGQIMLRCPCEPCQIGGGGMPAKGHGSDGRPLNGYGEAEHLILDPIASPSLAVPPALEPPPEPATDLYSPPPAPGNSGALSFPELESDLTPALGA